MKNLLNKISTYSTALLITGSMATIQACTPTEGSEQHRFFDPSKVLTVSTEDYCASVGKELSECNMIGLHGKRGCGASIFQTAPEGTEVIVAYRMHGGSCANTNQAGTALIPVPESNSTTKDKAQQSGKTVDYEKAKWESLTR